MHVLCHTTEPPAYATAAWSKVEERWVFITPLYMTHNSNIKSSYKLSRTIAT